MSYVVKATAFDSGTVLWLTTPRLEGMRTFGERSQAQLFRSLDDAKLAIVEMIDTEDCRGQRSSWKRSTIRRAATRLRSRANPSPLERHERRTGAEVQSPMDAPVFLVPGNCDRSLRAGSRRSVVAAVTSRRIPVPNAQNPLSNAGTTTAGDRQAVRSSAGWTLPLKIEQE